MTYIYITIDYATKLHNKILKVSWGREGYQDIWYVESVLIFIQNDEYYPTFEDKLTHILFGIAMNHGFVDGNKRTALELWSYFILLNFSNSLLAERLLITFENIMVEVVDKKIDKVFLHKLVTYYMKWDFDNESLKLELAHKIQ